MTPSLVTEWGGKYPEILAHEEAQFRALPEIVKRFACKEDSTRANGDIEARRFWTPYIQVNACLGSSDSMKANAEVVEFVYLRFNHWKPTHLTGSALNNYSGVSRRFIWRFDVSSLSLWT